VLSIRCKECGREVIGHATQSRSCGCPNIATVKGDSITARDLDKIVMLSSGNRPEKDNSLTPGDLQWQEERRKRKVRKLDFEVR
jgi:superfamily II helicase